MSAPRILLCHFPGLDLFSTEDLADIAAVGTLLNVEPLGRWDDPRAEGLLAEADVVLGHWGCPYIDAPVLDRAPHLGLIAYAAGTLKDTIGQDVFDRGLRVTSGAGANAEPVAEFTVAAILFANKDVLWRRDVLRDPSVGAARPPGGVPVGNWDKTVGIIGASFVGRRVMELLRAFPHLRVALYDPFVDQAEAAALHAVKMDLDELCASADVVSIHAPELPSTRRLVGARQLAAMRTGATLINTSRGTLVDQDALVSELQSGRLFALLDVTDPEPLPPSHALRELPNVFLTPHLAGSEGTELGRLTEYAIEEIRRWAAGEPARNPVTREQWDRSA